MKHWLKNKRIDAYLAAIIISSVTLGVVTLWIMAQQYRSLHIFTFSMVIFALVLILIIGSYLSTQNLQRQMEVTKLKSDFVSAVSHELKTPLSAIRLLAERLVKLSPEENLKQKEYISLILKQSYHLSHLISNILDFSKSEEGKEKFTFEKTDLSELLKKSIEEYPAALIRPDCALKLNIAAGLPLCSVDKEALSRAFINLLDNALKFSPADGTVTINIDKTNEEIFIEVIDHGPGLDEEESKKIFEPFYHSGKGTGLGLTLAKNSIEAHRGKLVFTSAKGQGSKFKIILPL